LSFPPSLSSALSSFPRTSQQYWSVSPLAEEGSPDEGLLVVPTSLDCSDWRFNATAVGWSSGKDWLRHLTDTFDTLYEEGEEGEAKMMTVSVHPRIAGRAGRAAFLEECVSFHFLLLSSTVYSLCFVSLYNLY
jgi:peptidoglycan/xylan/chitin deacetylase (PgdA/CDA1 family)